jgi:uncharacterized integral membrane protein
MGNLWLKIKIWTKVIAFALLTLAVLIFLIQNVNKSVTLWLWNDIETTLLKVVFFTALISVLFTVLLGTTFRTVRQIRELRSRNRSDKLEREVADMRAKAAMLQTKPVGGAAAGAPGASLEDVAPRVDDAQEPPSGT